MNFFGFQRVSLFFAPGELRLPPGVEPGTKAGCWKVFKAEVLTGSLSLESTSSQSLVV